MKVILLKPEAVEKEDNNEQNQIYANERMSVGCRNTPF